MSLLHRILHPGDYVTLRSDDFDVVFSTGESMLNSGRWTVDKGMYVGGFWPQHRLRMRKLDPPK